MIKIIVNKFRFLKNIISRELRLRSIIKNDPLKVYYGCGNVHQEDYVNVDIRWTPAVDMIANLTFCKNNLTEMCDEVFLSHVLEHFGYPGKGHSVNPTNVAGALNDVYCMLKIGGVVRIAVPDFRAIVRLYLEQSLPLYPRLLGRIYGEQDYPENIHKCGFDKDYLKLCLEKAGFRAIQDWSAEELGLKIDASYDKLLNVNTSLNLLGHKL